MIEPKNGYIAIKKPAIKQRTKGGIQKTDKMIADEIWQVSRKFEVLAVDSSQINMGIVPGDMVYMSPADMGQVLVIVEDKIMFPEDPWFGKSYDEWKEDRIENNNMLERIKEKRNGKEN